MRDTPLPGRRQLLHGAASVVAFGTLAGCSEGPEAAEGSGSVGDGTGTSGGVDSTDSGGPGSEDGSGTELDLREANVVDVAFERENGSYAFDVTLHHDDEGEEGFANWWQVERLDGTRLGRRELLHAHTQQPFTRSDTVEIPDDVTCVVVRGHDQTHEYGGRLMVVNLESGATRAVDQGSDPRSVDERDCP